jgi:class 3 adenylate cyclase
MDCGKCGAANKDGRRFCAKCGAPLERICAACGFANEAEDEFCGGCGAALKAAPPVAVAEPAPQPAPVTGERRQVTILFADLAGFTKLSSEHDPEDTHRILSRFFETVDGIVDSFGGAIDKHMGDSVSGLGDAYYSRGRMITALDYFRRCIDLCRQQGYGRIAVGNQYMVAWGRFYLNEVAGALEDALAAIESAQRVGHQRAEMVARLTAGRVLVESGDAAAAHPHVERGLELAESLGASRFKPFLLIYVARIRFARGAPADESVKLMREALDLARQTGAGFLAPWVLSTLALVSDEPAAALEALGEGEELLAEGCVGHNYYAFYRNAIEVALRLEDWRQAERYAEALSAYAAEEPLPWSEFVSARGRALAARGRGERGEANGHELERLRKEAEQAGLHAPLVAIQQALAAA